ncbi:hypothetical protein J010_05272 [Cryptococcus neoformans]|nr:hypothetical protein C355_05312 [Cryptococcus neoformans var. grubii Th84]OXG80491.1 hypothetical protein C346_05284 [Cryptococcus neoformans var. grubii D17-1]OXG93252.1 hypothetical protein C345_05179 [Cryptococcus neoformans var. grubii A2-102-5]OXH04402.1 hypothetical protein J010_05272 [Cryptococcus neoformans var. grubii]OXH45970.1 hypothetical protein J004_05329 [Cryptococcus neoformans var. grubii]
MSEKKETQHQEEQQEQKKEPQQEQQEEQPEQEQQEEEQPEQEQQEQEQPQQEQQQQQPQREQPQPQQELQQQRRSQDSHEPTFNMPPAPGPRTISKNPPRSETARDRALGPLRSHRVPLPNELSELTPEEQPGGSHKDDKHSLSINISLDLLVEVHLTARVKGDITIGLL